MSDKNGFRLQPVLNFKSSMVDLLEMEFGRLKVVCQDEVDALQVLIEIEDEEMDELRVRQKEGNLNCEEIQFRQQYLQALKDHLARQTTRVDEAKDQVEIKREELVETMQDEKVLEKLHERFQAEQAKEQVRRETSVVDDLVTSRYTRNNRQRLIARGHKPY